jgi:hypothetical protein
VESSGTLMDSVVVTEEVHWVLKSVEA